jgi:hypothetical protein
MVDDDENSTYPSFEPEDCESCGCPAGDFSDEDWDSGHYKCPECGCVC